jgi:uncharacterized protein YggU (UPF0235/DUF167 family)
VVEVRPGRLQDDLFVEDGRVRVHVRAIAAKGAANEAVERILEERIGEAGDTSLVSGLTSRTKMVRVTGGDPRKVLRGVLKVLRAVKRG